MSNSVTTLPEGRRSVLIDMATRFGMEPAAFEATLRATVVPGNCSREQFAAFLLVAKEYSLNPLTKEIYAFPTKSGGIQPIVSIDGWCNLINSHPKLDGIEFDDHPDADGKNLAAITARIWRKDREKPIVVTEYMAECARQTEPWKQWPRRMLRHKALIQCARYAFGFAGIVDPDEAERMGADVSPMRDVTPARKPPAPTEDIPASRPANGKEAAQNSEKPLAGETTTRLPSARASTAPAPKPDDGLDIPAALDRRPKKNALVAPSPTEDPEAWLVWVDATLEAVTDPDQLPTVWEERIELSFQAAFPPDQEEALGRFRKHETRLQP